MLQCARAGAQQHPSLPLACSHSITPAEFGGKCLLMRCVVGTRGDVPDANPSQEKPSILDNRVRQHGPGNRFNRINTLPKLLPRILQNILLNIFLNIVTKN